MRWHIVRLRSDSDALPPDCGDIEAADYEEAIEVAHYHFANVLREGGRLEAYLIENESCAD